MAYRGSEIQLAPEGLQPLVVFVGRQRRFGGFGKGRCLGQREFHAVHHLLAEAQVVALKHRKCHFLGTAGQEKPVTGQAGMVHRRMAPALGRLGAGRPAGLHIGAVGIGQTELHRVPLAGAHHPVQGWQKLGLFNDFACAPSNRVRFEPGQAVQPELLDLVEHLGIAVGLVILVVIIDAEQGKGLVEGINVPIGGGFALLLSGPSFGR